MTAPREWVQIGMLAHVVDYVADGAVTLCGEFGSLRDLSDRAPTHTALCAACYEADRREK